MFAFNFLFWLIGCAILGVGIWLRVDPTFQKYVDNSDNFNYLYTGAYILIFVGVLVMFIGFLGCCGAIRESQCMLCAFFVCLFIIFGALLAAGIWSIVAKDTLKTSVTETLQRAVDKYSNNVEAMRFMDLVQNNFKCCGAANGISDYKAQVAQIDPCDVETTTIPCDQKLFAYFSEHLIKVAGVGIGLGAVMVLGMIFSLMLCCAIREAEV